MFYKIFLSLIIALSIGTGFAAENSSVEPDYGWVTDSWKRNDEAANLMAAKTEKNRVAIRALQQIKFGDQDALNWRPLWDELKKNGLLTPEEISSGRLNSLDQKNVGSCVGWSTTIAGDHALANQAKKRELKQIWKYRMDPATTYAIGRQAGNQLGNWDGSTGAWSIRGLKNIGYLHRAKYPGFDLSNTTPSHAKAWAARGVPRQYLDAIIFKGDGVRAETVAEFKAALQGKLVGIVCAQASYGRVRDSLGFTRRSGRAWAHAMAVIGYRGPESGREGFLIQNSWTKGPAWSEWNSGPVWPEDQPKGSFWVTPQDLQFHLSQNDSWIITKLDAFERANLTPEEIFNFEGKLRPSSE